ncbi:hypothetical protein [Pelagibacterium limicola]|uniref:hypothetical protein n=1 Tax=Pelagibacterium limicola TaxID=2791022 RepID=UPI0018AFBC17|nr:hypothetical protein [Pelagibacterium limicola]
MSRSSINGVPEAKEMPDFCGEHGITSEVEVIAMCDINTACGRTLKGDDNYRIVVEAATLA